MKNNRPKASLIFGTLVALLSSLLLPLFTIPAFAQATTGSITGTVKDAAGAVVSGATVAAKNHATGVLSPTYETTSEGLYVVPNLIPGKYTLIVRSEGFKQADLTDIDVRLGQDSMVDVDMQPGAVSEVVTVTASAETSLQANTSQLSASFDSRMVTDLPSNVAGGGIDTLALLVPGVKPGFGNVGSSGTILSVNGGRSRSISFNIDGQDNSGLQIGGLLFGITNPDIVADYQVLTGNLPARYGRNSSSIVNIVTKTGTNGFHGSAFWFYRDQGLFDSRTNAEVARGLEKASPRLGNVYGATVGGPIVKDKAFFFGSYEGTTERRGNITVDSQFLAVLPAELPRLKASFPGNAAVAAIADFSAFAITDFGTVRPVPGKPTDTITIGGKPFMAGFPQRIFSQPFDRNEFTGRVDVKVSERDAIWARYLFQTSDRKNSQLRDSVENLVSGFTGDRRTRAQGIGGNWDHQVSSRSLNNFTVAYTRLRFVHGGGCEGREGCIADPIDSPGGTFTHIGLVFPGDAPGSNCDPNNPINCTEDVGALNNDLPEGRIEEVLQFADNFSLIRGKHQFLMGADIRRLRVKDLFLGLINGFFAFGSGDSLATNSPDGFALTTGVFPNEWPETDQFYYFHDDWKLRDNLTLNLGLRYEYATPAINWLHDETVARESNAATALWSQTVPLDARTVPRVPGDKNNFAPRLGLAYAPHIWKPFFGDATVIRAGYMIAYDPPFYNIFSNVSQSAPAAHTFTFCSSDCDSSLVFPIPDQFPTGNIVQAFAKASGIIPKNLDPRLFPQSQVASNFHSPYSQQWSLGIERRFAKNSIVEVRYLGTHGVGLFQTVDRNPKFDNLLNGFSLSIDGQIVDFPSFPKSVPAGLFPVTSPNPDVTGRLLPRASISSRENTAQSSYNALQSRYNGRLFNHLILDAAYTFSKAFDNASEVFGFFENDVPQNPFDTNAGERSLSGFDRRHVLSLNGIWDVPFFRGQKGVVGHLLGGWQVNGIYELASGQRFTPSQSINTNTDFRDIVYVDSLPRPFNGNANADPRSVGISQIDAALFFGANLKDQKGFYSLNDLLTKGMETTVTPKDVRYVFNGPGAAKIFGSPFGDVARNGEVGPRINIVNGGLFKNTRVGESTTIQFRTEVFNLFNHPNPGYGVISGSSTPNPFVERAGRVVEGFNDRSTLVPARRVIQFGLRIIF